MAEKEPQDSEFMEGLESMYLRVSAGEKAEEKASAREDLECQYAVLGLSPESSFEEVQWTYASLTQEWNPDRFPYEPAKQKQAEGRLKEIRVAYETILSAHGHQFKKDPSGSRDGNPMPAPAERKPQSPPARRWLFPILAFLSLLVVGGVLWSTIYYYDTFQSGGNVYPLRINRFTGSIAFFNGSQWSPPPLPILPVLKNAGGGSPSPVRPPQVPTPTAASKNHPASVEPSISAPSSSPPPAGLVPQAVPAIVIQGSEKPQPAEEGRLTAKNHPGHSAGETTAPPGRVYAIQIGAMSELRGAQELVASASKKGFEAYSVKDEIGGRQGYRVLLGRFATEEEAARYMRKRQIKKFYGDSFVRKLPAALAPAKEGA